VAGIATQEAALTLGGQSRGLLKPDSLRWIGACVGVIFLGLLGYLQRDRFLTGQNDFVQLYTGAQLSGTPGLYNPEVNKQVHIRALGMWLRSVYYSRPPFYALALRPLGALSYKTAYWLFETASLLALIAFLSIWTPRCRELLLIAGLSLPLLANLLTGQDLAFVLLAAALAVEAMRRNRSFAAGLLFSVCAIKVHLFVLVPLVLLLHRRWAVLIGGMVGGLAVFCASFLSDGVDWPKRYLALLSNPELHPGAEHMPTLRGLVHAFTSSEAPWITAILSFAIVLAVIHIGRRSNLEFGLAAALLAGLLIGYHAYLQDCTVLLLVFVLVLEHSQWVPLRAATGLVLMPPLFLFLTAGKPWNAVVPLAFLTLLAMAAVHPAPRASADLSVA
jgi:Glycosyltransferase family 87